MGEIIDLNKKVEKPMNEKIADEIKRLTIPPKVKKILEERLRLIQRAEEARSEYNTCLMQMLCPECGNTIVREKASKINFEPVTHKRKDVVTEVLKCSCGFEYPLAPEK